MMFLLTNNKRNNGKTEFPSPYLGFVTQNTAGSLVQMLWSCRVEDFIETIVWSNVLSSHCIPVTMGAQREKKRKNWKPSLLPRDSDSIVPGGSWIPIFSKDSRCFKWWPLMWLPPLFYMWGTGCFHGEGQAWQRPLWPKSPTSGPLCVSQTAWLLSVCTGTHTQIRWINSTGLSD